MVIRKFLRSIFKSKKTKKTTAETSPTTTVTSTQQNSLKPAIHTPQHTYPPSTARQQSVESAVFPHLAAFSEHASTQSKSTLAFEEDTLATGIANYNASPATPQVTQELPLQKMTGVVSHDYSPTEDESTFVDPGSEQARKGDAAVGADDTLVDSDHYESHQSHNNLHPDRTEAGLTIQGLSHANTTLSPHPSFPSTSTFSTLNGKWGVHVSIPAPPVFLSFRVPSTPSTSTCSTLNESCGANIPDRCSLNVPLFPTLHVSASCPPCINKTEVRIERPPLGWLSGPEPDCPFMPDEEFYALPEYTDVEFDPEYDGGHVKHDGHLGRRQEKVPIPEGVRGALHATPRHEGIELWKIQHMGNMQRNAVLDPPANAPKARMPRNLKRKGSSMLWGSPAAKMPRVNSNFGMEIDTDAGFEVTSQEGQGDEVNRDRAVWFLLGVAYACTILNYAAPHHRT